MDAEIQGIIRRASVVSAGLGFALGPVLTADGIAMLPVQAWMIASIAQARGRKLSELPWVAVAGATAVASVVRGAANVSLRMVPRAGRLSNVLTAVAMTRFVGWYTDQTCIDPEHPPTVSIRALWRELTTRETPEVTVTEP